MRGWSTEPVVREILDGFSQLRGARLLALEGTPTEDHRLVRCRVGALREIIVHSIPVGWVAIDGEAQPAGEADPLLDLAACVISERVAALDDLDSLSGEVAHIYEELGLLYSLSESLGAMRDEVEICDAVLTQAQRVIGADQGSILLVDEEQRLLRPVVKRNIPDAAGQDSPIHAGEGISGYVLATGRAMIIEDTGRIPAGVERNDKGLPADHHLVRPPLLSAPMRARGMSVGVINLWMKPSGKPFTSHDLKLAQALASEAAVFIEINRVSSQAREGARLRGELEIARTIQQALLPRCNPIIPGMDVAGLCCPASDVGGDYYGFIEGAVPGMTGLAIMDVAGHSVGAAMCMASTRSILRCEAWSRRSTRDVVERVNDLVCQDLEDGGLYATLVYAIYEHATGEVRYTNAGHPAPLLLNLDEQRCRRLTQGGMGVGISSNQSYREESLRMTSGDLLLLYTDGLSEARSPSTEMFGETRLAQALARYRHSTAWEIVTALVGEVKAFVGAVSQADDIALIVMKATSVGSRQAGVPST